MVALSQVLIAAFTTFTVAHPGEKHDAQYIEREIVARDTAARVAARSLASCSNSTNALALKGRSIKRRAETVQKLRQERGIKTRMLYLQAWETVNHNQTSVYNYDEFTPLETIFGANTSCILAPIITNGPYYAAGEYLRSNVLESEFCDGINLFLEVQYIDINTCEPLPSVAVDIWNCNATGVYSGVDSAGEAGVNTTFLRGIQLTDHDGVTSFETIFPGHYYGRAVHTHLLAYSNATLEPNGTISIWEVISLLSTGSIAHSQLRDAPVTHIGQLFYPDDLIAEVEATYPYNTNTIELTTNDEDMWSVLQADSSYDPFPEYLYLGDDITDGLFAWIQIGVNASADYSTNSYYGVAAYLGEDGGHSTGYTIGGGSGPGGGEGGNGTFPSGRNSGAAQTSTAA